MVDLLTLRKKINRIRKKFHDFVTNYDFVKKTMYLVLPGYIGLVIVGVIIAYAFGGTGQGPGTYYIWTNWISDLGGSPFTPAPYLYDIACILAGGLMIPFTFYLEKLLVPVCNKTTRLRYRIGSYAFITSLIGNIGYVLVGIFSEDRNFYGMHMISSGMAFIGFQIGAFFTGWLIVLYDTKIPKGLGVYGIFGPISCAIIYAIIGGPFLEWMMLFTILIWVIPLSLLILHNEELHI